MSTYKILPLSKTMYSLYSLLNKWLNQDCLTPVTECSINWFKQKENLLNQKLKHLNNNILSNILKSRP